MTIEFKSIERLSQPKPDKDSSVKSTETEFQRSSESLRQAVDELIKTYIYYASKDNEGQQAIIFKAEFETNLSAIDEEDRAEVENYIGRTSNIKILKVTDKEAAENEFDWHRKAYEAYQGVPDDEKHKYAGIPQPFINKTFEIDEELRTRLNSQNAKITSDEASVMVMEWIDGEDLLAKMFRQYLAEQPGYEGTAENPLIDFRSLLIAINTEFKNRGLDFEQMETLEQYQRLFKVIAKKQDILTNDQQEQIKNTLELLHSNRIYHNDLHLRNYLVEEGTGRIFIIDFGRSAGRKTLHENDIKDEMVLNFALEYRQDKTKNGLAKSDLDRDIKRIMAKDKSFPATLKSVKSKKAADLFIFMERESSQWRVNPWDVMRYAAVVRALESVDANKSELIKEYMKDKAKGLAADSRAIIESL